MALRQIGLEEVCGIIVVSFLVYSLLILLCVVFFFCFFVSFVVVCFFGFYFSFLGARLVSSRLLLIAAERCADCSTIIRT